jgi:hypothetical protein
MFNDKNGEEREALNENRAMEMYIVGREREVFMLEREASFTRELRVLLKQVGSSSSFMKSGLL